MKLFKDVGFYFMEIAIVRLNEIALGRLVKGGETTAIEFQIVCSKDGMYVIIKGKNLQALLFWIRSD